MHLDLAFARRHALPLCAAGVAIIGLIVAVRAHRSVLYDDAAITMRYAYRIAHGHGWTYNDGDRTNGASAPLYTMILAAMSRVGWDLETAAKAIGVACFAATIGLATWIAARIAGLAAGLVAAVFLLVSLEYEVLALSGMESALAAALGLAAIALLLEERETWAAIFLGLALVNKLDAGMLALAIAVVYVAIMRRPPWRIIAISAAVLAPWLVFSLAYFGSVLPYSMTQKLGPVQNPSNVYDPSWILDAIRANGSLLVALLALGAVAAIPALARTNRYFALALGTCLGWPLLHGLVFSVLNFGDPYPWYRTVLYPPMAIAAAVTVVLAVRAAGSRPIAIAAAAAVVVFVAGITDTRFGNAGTVVRTVAHGHQIDGSEAFEATRRDAGRYVGRVAAEHDVITTCYGWVAYGALDNPISETCPLNTRVGVGPPRWVVVVSYPGVRAPKIPAGGELKRSFLSDSPPGGATYVIEIPKSPPTKN